DLQLEAPDVAQVLFRVVAGGGTAHQELAAALEAPERRLPGRPAGEVDHHVDAAFVRTSLRLAIALDRPLGEVDLAIVDDLGGAALLGPAVFVGCAGAADPRGPEQLHQDHAAVADPAAGAEDEHALAGLDRLVGDQHAVRGAVGHGKRRRLLVAHAGRHGD